MFRNRLTKVYRHISRQARRQGITCYRVYDHDLPEFPFCIELYEEAVYVAEYRRAHGMDEAAHDAWLQSSLDIITEVTGHPQDTIYLKLRKRKPGRLGQYQKLDQAGQFLTVKENGLSFLVNLSDYLDTGLFLDHRITRQMVRDAAAGKKVLNLFAYTGSFSVYAAAGGATVVETVDLSNTYINWAKRNFEANELSGPGFKFVQADVLQYLAKLPGESFDIIVLDPPTFSNSQRMESTLDIQRDHAKLVNECLRVLQKGGQLYFSTNARRFQLDKASIRTEKIKDITRATTPFDFEGKLFRWCYLIEK